MKAGFFFASSVRRFETLLGVENGGVFDAPVFSFHRA
jgi:hypothetical protein